MKKIGFVTPWYGDNISGGAEAELRGLVKHLQESGVELEILTTCVKDFNSDWNTDFYEEGLTTDGGIQVRRFKVRERDTKAFDAVNLKLMKGMKISSADEEIYMREMINSEGLIDFIKENQNDYSLFVGIPYMFGPVYQTALAVPDKFVLIPCLHDESYAYMKLFCNAYSKIAGIVFNAKPEHDLANTIYDLSNVNQIVAGVGIYTDISGDSNRFREKYKIDSPFILYAGRKDAGKNVDMLLKYFVSFKKCHGDTDLKVVLIGGGNIEIPESVKDDVHDLGFVDIQDKYDAYSAATLLCQPSTHESFSIVIMESWLCHRPVLVHGKCEVTKNFAIESNGGLYFNDYYEFDEAVTYFLSHEDECRILAENGRRYVLENFSWDVIVKKMTDYFEEVAGEYSERVKRKNQSGISSKNTDIENLTSDTYKCAPENKVMHSVEEDKPEELLNKSNERIDKPKEHICVVSQRYGLEVNGGAELLAREFAEKLIPYYDVDVFTTKAVTYTTWANEYTADKEEINDVTVYRFPVEHDRDPKKFNSINEKFMNGNLPKGEEDKWFEEQGPYCPKLIEAIKKNAYTYKAFLFNTYLYYPSIYGIPALTEFPKVDAEGRQRAKAIFIPDAHDEPYLRFDRVKKEFEKTDAFFFNTKEECTLARSRFRIGAVPTDIGGGGVDIPDSVNADRFREKYKDKGLGTESRFIIYVGRIDEGKNCDVLFKYFKEYKKQKDNDLKLVLMGKAAMAIPKDPDIISLGFVSDQDKFDGIKAADILVLPSKNESLSFVVLESMFVGTPVMVNGACAVLKGHCIHSNGALWFTNYQEFAKVIDFYEDPKNTDAVDVMHKRSKKYVDENYQWERIIEKLSRLIEKV